MKFLLISLFSISLFAQAPKFKEVTCWNKAGQQIFKMNALKVEIDENKVEIYLKSHHDEPDYVMAGVSCMIKKL